jgi:hypothetical protein
VKYTSIPTNYRNYTFLISCSIYKNGIGWMWLYPVTSVQRDRINFFVSIGGQNAFYRAIYTVIILNVDIINSNPLLNLLQYDLYPRTNNIFPTSTLYIDTAKYGIDLRGYCVIGFQFSGYFPPGTMNFKFDLTSSGVINGYNNFLGVYGNNRSDSIQTLCIADKLCPSTHQFRALNSIYCYDCSISKFIPYLIF